MPQFNLFVFIAFCLTTVFADTNVSSGCVFTPPRNCSIKEGSYNYCYYLNSDGTTYCMNMVDFTTEQQGMLSNNPSSDDDGSNSNSQDDDDSSNTGSKSSNNGSSSTASSVSIVSAVALMIMGAVSTL